MTTPSYNDCDCVAGHRCDCWDYRGPLQGDPGRCGLPYGVVADSYLGGELEAEGDCERPSGHEGPCGSWHEARLQGDPGLLRERIAAIDLGLYPASVNGVPRTEWQDGWNAGATAYEEAVESALAATPAEPPIDVERLARALPKGGVNMGWDYPDEEYFRRAAAYIAAEYARLSNPAQRETER